MVNLENHPPGIAGLLKPATLSGRTPSPWPKRFWNHCRQPAWVNPFTSKLRKVNMQIVVAAVPGQEAITRDNVTLRLHAVVYHRVVDPIKAIINVQNYQFAVPEVAQTSLRSVIGQSDMDHLLSEREKINAHLKDVIDAPTEQPWGIRAPPNSPGASA